MQVQALNRTPASEAAEQPEAQQRLQGFVYTINKVSRRGAIRCPTAGRAACASDAWQHGILKSRFGISAKASIFAVRVHASCMILATSKGPQPGQDCVHRRADGAGQLPFSLAAVHHDQQGEVAYNSEVEFSLGTEGPGREVAKAVMLLPSNTIPTEHPLPGAVPAATPSAASQSCQWLLPNCALKVCRASNELWQQHNA